MFMAVLIAALIPVTLFSSTAQAAGESYRWDNGQILGTGGKYSGQTYVFSETPFFAYKAGATSPADGDVIAERGYRGTNNIATSKAQCSVLLGIQLDQGNRGKGTLKWAQSDPLLDMRFCSGYNPTSDFGALRINISGAGNPDNTTHRLTLDVRSLAPKDEGFPADNDTITIENGNGRKLATKNVGSRQAYQQGDYIGYRIEIKLQGESPESEFKACSRALGLCSSNTSWQNLLSAPLDIHVIEIKKEATPATEAVCSAGALGWVICPAMSMMADVTTWVAGQLQSYLAFNPFSSSGGGDIKRVWSSLLAIANSLLVVAFLVVIFSQSTSVGLSSYGVKRMLPRIIAAAILMNLSYYICQILVDLSNIAGVGVAGLVSSATSGTFADNVEQVSNLSKILVGAGIIAIVAFFFLIPVALSFLAVIFTIAARNALIVLLVMVAPLAFAAWILPNTEKYFRKWWELLVNLLLLFPLVMLVFSASIVAANVIASTPPSSGQGSTELNGMIALLVLALPLFAMPFMFKVAGGAISRINALTQQQLQRGADSKAGQFARDRTKRYGKFAGLTAAGGAAMGAGYAYKKTAGRTKAGQAFGRGATTVGRKTQGAWRSTRALDAAMQHSLDARKQGIATDVQERAARMGATGKPSPLLQGVGGSRYGEITASRVEEEFSKRKAAIKAKYDQEHFDKGSDFFQKRLESAIESNDAAEAAAVVDYLTSARGAGGRRALEQSLVTTAGKVQQGSEVHKAIHTAINRDNYSTLVSKRGGIAKGGYTEVTDAQGNKKLEYQLKLGDVGTEQLATQDATSLFDNLSQVKPEEAHLILENEELKSKIPDAEARKILEQIAATYTPPGGGGGP